MTKSKLNELKLEIDKIVEKISINELVKRIEEDNDNNEEGETMEKEIMKENTRALNDFIKVMYDNYSIDGNEISDTIHTFGELYDYRMLYNALWVNSIVDNTNYKVLKSKRHEDGQLCFGGGWFIVVVVLPDGTIVDNHYEEKYWDLFKCNELEKSDVPYDGHTPNDVKNGMFNFLQRG